MAEIVTRIREGAMFTFDFLLLLLLASIIAFVGLVENSSVILVASMLVSPLMGPILAGVFGAVIRDRHLTMKGIIHETQESNINFNFLPSTFIMISFWKNICKLEKNLMEINLKFRFTNR